MPSPTKAASPDTFNEDRQAAFSDDPSLASDLRDESDFSREASNQNPDIFVSGEEDKTNLSGSSAEKTNNPNSLEDIRNEKFAWDGVKKEIAQWARTDGESVQRGSVIMTAATQSENGQTAEPGYHYVRFERDGQNLEILVHGRSGDMRSDQFILNGKEISKDEYSPEVFDEAMAELKTCVDEMENSVTSEAPKAAENEEEPKAVEKKEKPKVVEKTENPEVIVPEKENNSDFQEQNERLINKLYDSNFLYFVENNSYEKLGKIGGAVDSSSPPEEIALVKSTYAYAAELGLSERFADERGVNNFSQLGENIADVGSTYENLSSNERAQHLEKWLKSMQEYIQISDDGRVVVEDDRGTQFLIEQDGSSKVLTEPIGDLNRIPSGVGGQALTFMAVRAVIGGAYEPNDLFMSLQEAKGV
jgi:hypothetical protein